MGLLHPSASIGGQLIDDVNYNVLDGEETGQDGVTIRLFNLQNELQATTTTANGGFYDFGAIASGEYYVEIDRLATRLERKQWRRSAEL